MPARQCRIGCGRLQLCQRGGDDYALLLASAQRGELAIFQLERAGGLERAIDDDQIGRPFDLECAEVRIPAHHGDFGNAVVEGQMRLLRDHRHAPRQRLPGQLRQRNPAERDAAALRPSRPREQPQQRRLSRAIGSEDADETVGRDVQRHAGQHGCRRRRESRLIRKPEISGLQQRAHLPWRCARAPGTRTPPRTTD